MFICDGNATHELLRAELLLLSVAVLFSNEEECVGPQSTEGDEDIKE